MSASSAATVFATTRCTICRSWPASLGALRDRATFKDWELPSNLTKLRARLGRSDEADRQFVGILAAIPEDGLDAVEDACRLALSEGLCSRDAVLNIL